MTRLAVTCSRWLLTACLLAVPVLAAEQNTSPQPELKVPDPKGISQEPPEEDELSKPKEYVLNPLQAEKEFKIGLFYQKKGSLKAATRRFEEATKWNPGFAEAFLKLGDVRLKQNDKAGAREAYSKYLEIEPEGRESDSLRKKLAHKL